MRQILHISDVHFGPPHRAHLAEAVQALAEERSPDLVVISGDLTQRAKPRQFREARAWVDRFAAPTVEIPGNHDVPMYRVWERAFSPSGAYRRHFRPELRMTFRDAELGVVAVNTAHGWTIDNGRLTAAELRWAVDELERMPEGLCRIFVAHHPLIPVPRFGHQEVLVGARRGVRRLARAGVELILGGHKHQAYSASSEAFYPESPPMVVAHSGTTTSNRGRGSERGRNSLNWVTIDSESITVEPHLYEPSEERFLAASSHRYRRRRRAEFQ